MGLFAELKAEWRGLRRGRPGRRFVDRFERAAKKRQQSHWLTRGLKISAGVLALVLGLVEIVFPGPALLFFALGGGLLATQSRRVAQVMDWSEVHLRSTVNWARARWRAASKSVRSVIFATAAAAGGAGAYGTYQLLVS